MKGDEERGAKVWEAHQSGKALENKDREAIVAIVVQAMVNKYGHYPDSKVKEMMAIDIVSTFPSLEIKNRGVASHSHFFNNSSGGFLQARLNHIRQSLPADQKQRKRTAWKKDHPQGSKKAKTELECPVKGEEKERLIKVFIIFYSILQSVCYTLIFNRFRGWLQACQVLQIK